MSDQRKDLMAQNQLASQLADLEQEFTELRSGTPQFIGGASIKYFVSTTANTFDWSGTVGSSGEQDFVIKAVPVNAPVFWGNIYGDLFVDSSTSAYGGLQACTDVAAGGANLVNTVYNIVPNSAGDDPSTASFSLTLTAPPSRSIWIKFYILGIDEATVTVTALV